MISPLSSFLSFATLGMSILFSFSVPTQSVECLIFSLHTNSGLLSKLSSHSVFPWPNKCFRISSTIAAVLGLSGVIRLDCRTVFLPVYTRKHRKYPVLDSHIVKVAMPPVSLLSQLLNKVHWLKTCRTNTSNYRAYVDSYTKWTAESFSAYLQKELTHDIHVDFKSAAHTTYEVHATPCRPRGKIFQATEFSVAFMNESFKLPQKKPKILAYKHTVFRLQLYFFQFE